jgi:hypothetical protein|tara:strand:- start:4 stop:219 length:216 start_codon:yes stop_codon:yes gene_type:complete
MRIKSKLDNNINIDRFKNIYREELRKPKVDINELNAKLNLTKKENFLQDIKLLLLLVSLVFLVIVSISVLA